MPSPPSSRQLLYLKALANRTGKTFTYPTTSSEASGEIQRLKRATPSSRNEIRIERKQISDQIANGPITNATAIRDDELTGHGSATTRAPNRHPQSHPTRTTPAPPQPRLGTRTELARYTLPEGERVLYGQRIDGVVRFLPDEPVVLDSASGSSEKSGCCPREPLQADGSSRPARQKRANDDRGSAQAAGAATPRPGRTGPRVELTRYSIPTRTSR